VVLDLQENVVSVNDSSGGSSTRTFDEVGRLKTVTDNNGKTTTYTYDMAGLLTNTVLPGGVSQARTFDPAAQLVSLTNTGPQGLIRSYGFQRDAVGNPLKIDVGGPTGPVPAESQLLTYDSSYRLRKQCWSNTACVTANQTAWTYDQVGNRLTEKIGAAPVTNYTYDPLTDQLQSTTQGGVITNFGYNANGDQVNTGGVTSTFNTARQTVSVNGTNGNVTYAYDGDGNRVKSTVSAAGGSSQVTMFDWDTTSSGLANVVAEHNNAGNVQRRYTYGNDLVSMRNLSRGLRPCGGFNYV
jgi:YD repeat-containing protein